MATARIGNDFFSREVLLVAPELIGKKLCRQGNTGLTESYIITEVEAYRGTDDLACHASKGRTPRTEVMFGEGGHIYVYLIYGMHWMLNFVTGPKNDPQAVLIRGLKECYGPGKLTQLLGIDKSFYGEDLSTSPRIWVEDGGFSPKIESNSRIGIDYAGVEWASKPWRFTAYNLK